MDWCMLQQLPLANTIEYIHVGEDDVQGHTGVHGSRYPSLHVSVSQRPRLGTGDKHIRAEISPPRFFVHYRAGQ